MVPPLWPLLRCELVNTVDSTNIDTPIIGLVIEDAWNDGRVIVPAGTEVHGVAQKSAVRERIGSDRQWFLVFQDGGRIPHLRCGVGLRPAGLRLLGGIGRLRGPARVRREIRQICGSQSHSRLDDFRGGGRVPGNDYAPLSFFGGATLLGSGGIESAFSAGLQAGGQLYSKRLLERLDKDPFYVRVPAGTTFYLYVTQTVDLGKATVGLSASIPPPTNPTHP